MRRETVVNVRSGDLDTQLLGKRHERIQQRHRVATA